MIILYFLFFATTIVLAGAIFGAILEREDSDVITGLTALWLAFGAVSIIIFNFVPQFSKEIILENEVIENYIVQEYDKGISIIVGGELFKYETFGQTELIRKKEFTIYKQTFAKSEHLEDKRIEYKIFNFKGEKL